MPRRANPYYAPSGPYQGVAEGITNLGAMFMPPDAANVAGAEASAWGARKAREDVVDTRAARQGRSALGDLFANYDRSTYDPRQVLAESIRSGAYDPAEIGTLFRVGAGNLPGMTEEDRTGALVGTGTTLGPNAAVSMDHQDRIRRENRQADMMLQGMQEAGKDRRADADDTPGGYGISADQKRYLEAQDSMRDELGIQLQGMGVPVDKEGNLRADLLPPGYFEEVTRRAVDAARQDNFQRDYAAYVSGALQAMDQVPTEYTEDNIPILGFGEEELRMGAPSGMSDPSLGALFQTGGTGAPQGAPQAASPGGGTQVRMPDGAVVTPDEIAETARNRGVSPAQVVQFLQQQGGEPIVPEA